MLSLRNLTSPVVVDRGSVAKNRAIVYGHCELALVFFEDLKSAFIRYQLWQIYF